MNSEDVRKMDELVAERIRIKKGQTLYALGEPLEAVYGIRFGTLKTHLTLEDGRHQITGFHLPGEIVGLDGIGDMCHVSDATALEDTEVCVVRYDQLQLSAAPVLAHHEQGDLAGSPHAADARLDAR